MVRLIASDMDGTLLDEKSSVPKGTFGLITALQEKGVRFCASSGRRYDTLREFFGPIADRIDYVASAGTQVYADGMLLDYEVFSSRSVQRLYALCAQLDCLHLALYGRTNTFLLDDLDHYVREIDKDLPRAVRVNRPPSPDVGIVKAAICYERADDIMDMVYVLERELGDVFVFMPSGKTWIDVVPRGINKATGLQAVLKHHGIDPRDVLAFGDSMDSVAVSWVSNAYGLTFGGFLLLAGRMGDLAGSKKLLVAGLAVFSASAVLWAWRSSPRALRAWGPRGPSIRRSS